MLNEVIKMAENKHRKAIEMTYNATCTIKECQSIKDPITKVTGKKLVTVLENQPCSISYKSVTTANQTESVSTVQQVIKLFIAPEIIVREGSKLEITHDGIMEEFKNSGKSAVYSSHQEIVLELLGNA